MTAAAFTAGTYAINGRSYLAEATRDGLRLRYIRSRTGKPAREILAHIRGESIQLTGNGMPHATHLMALACNPAVWQIAMHCAEPGCGRTLTDPASVAARRGPEHRPAA